LKLTAEDTGLMIQKLADKLDLHVQRFHKRLINWYLLHSKAVLHYWWDMHSRLHKH